MREEIVYDKPTLPCTLLQQSMLTPSRCVWIITSRLLPQASDLSILTPSNACGNNHLLKRIKSCWIETSCKWFPRSFRPWWWCVEVCCSVLHSVVVHCSRHAAVGGRRTGTCMPWPTCASCSDTPTRGNGHQTVHVVSGWQHWPTLTSGHDDNAWMG